MKVTVGPDADGSEPGVRFGVNDKKTRINDQGGKEMKKKALAVCLICTLAFSMMSWGGAMAEAGTEAAGFSQDVEASSVAEDGFAADAVGYGAGFHAAKP